MTQKRLIEIVVLGVLIAILALVVSGCERERAAYAQATRTSVCVSGVRYLIFSAGVTVMYSPDGRVVTCQRVR